VARIVRETPLVILERSPKGAADVIAKAIRAAMTETAEVEVLPLAKKSGESQPEDEEHTKEQPEEEGEE